MCESIRIPILGVYGTIYIGILRTRQLSVQINLQHIYLRPAHIQKAFKIADTATIFTKTEG